MRGSFPIFLATAFGIMNGIYIFQPMVMDARLEGLKRQGIDVGAVGNENKREEEVEEALAREKAIERVKSGEGQAGKKWSSWWPW